MIFTYFYINYGLDNFNNFYYIILNKMLIYILYDACIKRKFKVLKYVEYF